MKFVFLAFDQIHPTTFGVDGRTMLRQTAWVSSRFCPPALVAQNKYVRGHRRGLIAAEARR